MMRGGRRKEVTATAMVAAVMMVAAGVAEAWTFETLKEAYVEKNKWMHCASSGWPNCLRDMGGYNLISGVFCPYAVYWECEYAWRIGRRPVDQMDPYWDDRCCDPLHQPGNSSSPSHQ
ncbi:hypothetical protein H6P81_015415 [Aristolochia fimbriata]|uniref:Uncharacterized protein n=1 Tax=Aristolochia fimbriata TaxID=158543 RepID=A0AAV7E5G2_ARIFI|nr:hypothetical protein H6P81_015415 [Aristolochia fimbriata]